MKLTPAQAAALANIARHSGQMPLYAVKGRMVDKYRVARTLRDKGLVTITNAGRDSSDYLLFTAAGRAAYDAIIARAAIARAEARP